MIEVALVFDKEGKTIHWHLPPGRSGVKIPDSRDLWSVLWENRHRLGGVAHTHPWNGGAWASHEDVTTFDAVERGLGQRLLWPIATFTEVKGFVHNVVTGEYVPADITIEIEGIEELWARSR